MGNCFTRTKKSTVALGQSEVLQFVSIPVLWIYGGPGAGKRTQTEMIVESFGFTPLHTLDILHVEAMELTTRGIDISTHIENNERIPAKLMIDMLKENILSNMKLANGFVICDFPNDLETGVLFEKEICKVSRILYLRSNMKTMRERSINKISNKKNLRKMQDSSNQVCADSNTTSSQPERSSNSQTSPLPGTSPAKPSKNNDAQSEEFREVSRISSTSAPSRAVLRESPKTARSTAPETSKSNRCNAPEKNKVSGKGKETKRSKAPRKSKTPEEGKQPRNNKAAKMNMTSDETKMFISPSTAVRRTDTTSFVRFTTQLTSKNLRDVKKSGTPRWRESTNFETVNYPQRKYKGNKHPSTSNSRKSHSSVTRNSGAATSNAPRMSAQVKNNNAKIKSKRKSTGTHRNVVSRLQKSPTIKKLTKSTSQRADVSDKNTTYGKTSYNPRGMRQRSTVKYVRLPLREKAESGIQVHHTVQHDTETKLPEAPQSTVNEDFSDDFRENSDTSITYGEEPPNNDVEKQIQDFYAANTAILTHFSERVTQINTERNPIVVFEAVKRAINETCSQMGLAHLIQPLDHITETTFMRSTANS